MSGKNNITRPDSTWAGGRNLSFEGPKTWADRPLGRGRPEGSSAPERSEKDRFGQALLNRGYIKLSDAASAFNFDFRGKVVLDIGSSTGGFTQYALDSGAKKVIAIEKGTNQMVKPLRYDKHVELHEKTDIFNTDNMHPDIIVADVSFVSLKKVLSYAKEHLSNQQTDFLVMLKPQFEARQEQLNKGIIKNEKIRRDIIKDFEQWLKQNDFIIIQKRDNSLEGKHGNLERFYWLKPSAKIQPNK